MTSEGTTRADGEEAGLLHPIGEAARLTGVSRGVIRLWERERLIAPRRSAGGHRLYSSGDLQRLRQITRLRRMDRLNAAAIRRELGASEDGAVTQPATIDIDLGRRLRALRTSRGLSLASVAETVGLSVSFLSAVELGQSSISVGNLFKLADAYGTTVPGLSAEYRTDERNVLHPEDRPRYVAGQGLIVIEDLIATPGAIEAQRIEIKPNAGSEEPYAHPGEEFIYVLAGQLTFWLEERQQYILGEGDSLYFRSTQLHRWWNESRDPVSVLWINVPIVDGNGKSPGPRTTAHRRGADAPPGGRAP